MASPKNSFNPTKTFLLTGAGFTKSFGGYLGSEMWAAILNQSEVQNDQELRQALIRHPNLDFEAVYNEIQSSEAYTATQKSSLTNAIRKAYGQMDNILRESAGSNAVAACRRFIRLFSGSRKDRTVGFVFTLNQDLLMERFYVNDDQEKMMSLPVLRRPEWFRCNVGPLFGDSDKDELELPDKATVERDIRNLWSTFTTQLMYVKLHGSFGWRSKQNSDVMIIGHDKFGAIQKEPLLTSYLSLFEYVLNQGDQKLLIIGYSFRDEHINEILIKAIRNSKLRIYYISPKAPIDFRNELFSLPKPRHHVTELWNSLAGYFPGTIDYFYEPDHEFIPARAKNFLATLGLLT